MSNTRDDLDRQIAELEEALVTVSLASVRQFIIDSLDDLRAKRAVLNTVNVSVAATGGATHVSGGRVYGGAIGVNQGTMQNFFGTKPPEDANELLADYLAHLVITCNELRLSRILKRDRTGADRAAAPALKLQDVYTSLLSDGDVVRIGKHHTRSFARVRKILSRLDRLKVSTEYRPSEQARGCAISGALLDVGTIIVSPGTAFAVEPHLFGNTQTPDDATVSFQLTRPELVFDAIASQQHLVLLGEPGYGKSTVLHYLAHLLARRGRGDSLNIPGWLADDTPIPILLPLGSVAVQLEAHHGNADTALWQVLETVFDSDQGVRAGLRDQLKSALRRGGVLLLLDGLDELPAAADGGPRARVAGAIMRLVDQTGARVVVTSRVLPYLAAVDWQFPEDANWVVRTIKPLTFGQMRTFVIGWYRALVPLSSDLTSERADAQANDLIEELEQNTRLRLLVQSPLLLTMLTLLHYNSKGIIPRDRARLYDECVQLLLERWEPVRSVDLREHTSRLHQLLAQLSNLEVDKLRDIIHELAYTAHASPPGDDGRGLINRDLLEGRLLRFFRFLRSSDPGANVTTLLEIIREEAGLLVARDDETAYAFPHLTFQEYLAACWLADRAGGSGPQSMAKLAYAHWRGDDRERWRVVLLLLMGRLRQQGKVDDKVIPWLHLLASPRLGRQPKAVLQWQWDTLLAVASYRELGGRQMLVSSLLDIEALVETPLRHAIVSLLEQPDPAITLRDRITIAQTLADLGDLRFPVSIDQWCNELFPTTFGEAKGYWCYMPRGDYRIGGWSAKESSTDITLSEFWIARFLITVAQFAPFVAKGYGPDADRWWTSNGWAWKQESNRTQPQFWGEADYHGTNQPVIGASWYEATAFCAWLSELLADVLPEGYVLRLPTEAEWEAAAAYDTQGQRHSYPWGEDEPTLDQAIYEESGIDRPAPVGCCPTGVAPCGALDLVGNMWEWMASSYRVYPKASGEYTKDFMEDDSVVPLRGGSYYNDITYIRCGARYYLHPTTYFLDYGFRVVVATRIGQ